jgi:methionyl-tRNA synthetase
MTDKIPIKEFSKLDIRVGLIKKAEPHPNADKLLVLTVDLNEDSPRTIVAGLKNHYTLEELENKKAIFITNLQPANLRGVESNGMILAAASEDDEKIKILIPDQDIEQGSKIR